ncbi:bifunctional oligoribonuclease/PAP phosphatase NrnA [Candidatus Peregrinibacteria bacterium]|nr:bifunctional oligoribonuclease/PAP phosphatase NrnA [Candidatus Peregrinibacteria bacterium]
MEDAFKIIDQSEKILILSHRNPDGDTIGANLALHNVLAVNGKQVISACADQIPFSLVFLPGSSKILINLPDDKPDLIITVDASSPAQLKYENIITTIQKKDIPVLNIDHHATNKKFGTENLVDVNAASTTEVLYNFFKFMEIGITPQIATCLLAGLYSDTGSFMHSNTSRSSFDIASDLMSKGASLSFIIENMFKTHTVEQLRLWGRVLENARKNKNGSIVSKVTQSDFDETQSSPRDLTGIINYLNSVPNTKMTILLAEDTKGNVKGSIRTQNNKIDATKISGKFGGGGHAKAAGFTIPGKIISEEVWRIEKLD